LFYNITDVSDKLHTGNRPISGFKQIRRANNNYRCAEHWPHKTNGFIRKNKTH